MEGAYVVMGSASPSVESYYKAQTGTYRLVRLEQRYGGSSLPAVSIVDLREELKTGNRVCVQRTAYRENPGET